MLSGVGAHATTQSKHPEDAGHYYAASGSSPETFSPKPDFTAALLGYILPTRIGFLNESYLLPAPPPLQLLFAVDGRYHVIVCFVVNESMHFVFLSEAFNGFDFVLPDSSSQVSHANIQGAGATHDDVNPEFVKRTLTHGASDVSTGYIGRTPCCGFVATGGIGMFRLRAATVRAALRST